MNALVRLEAQGNALRARAATKWHVPAWAHYADVSTHPPAPSPPPVKQKADVRSVFPVLGGAAVDYRQLFPVLAPEDDIDPELLAAAFAHALDAGIIRLLKIEAMGTRAEPSRTW
jgi:hypothetical protein